MLLFKYIVNRNTTNFQHLELFEYSKIVKSAQFEYSMGAIRMLDYLFGTADTAQ